jgi:hypothetical protein
MNPVNTLKVEDFTSDLVSNEILILLVEFYLNLFDIQIMQKKFNLQNWSIIFIYNLGPFDIRHIFQNFPLVPHFIFFLQLFSSQGLASLI